MAIFSVRLLMIEAYYSHKRLKWLWATGELMHYNTPFPSLLCSGRSPRAPLNTHRTKATPETPRGPVNIQWHLFALWNWRRSKRVLRHGTAHAPLDGGLPPKWRSCQRVTLSLSMTDSLLCTSPAWDIDSWLLAPFGNQLLQLSALLNINEPDLPKLLLKSHDMD